MICAFCSVFFSGFFWLSSTSYMNCVDMDSECCLTVSLYDKLDRVDEDSCDSVKAPDAFRWELIADGEGNKY